MKYIAQLFTLFFILTNTIYADAPQVAEMFFKRHSGKSYDPSRTVTKEQIATLIEATRWTPSSHNDQPWYFIICDRQLSPEAYEKAFNTLKDTQQAWIKNAPLIIAIITRTKETYAGKLNYWGEYDTGAAAMSMALQATELGLMAHQIGGFDKEQLIADFALPADHKPMALMVLGYEEDNPPIGLLRMRRAIQETFFLGTWGIGFPAE